MKRVLITGASGFVGRQCVSPLLAKGFEVHAVSRKGPAADTPSEVRWHALDLTDADRVSELLARVRPTHLLHLAWYAEPGKYWTSAENLRWVSASLGLFEGFAAAGGRRAVGAGTCAEYDWHAAGLCKEFETPLAPATLYGACKHALRVVLEAYARQAGLSAAWGRVFFLHGPHEHPDRLVASVARALLRGEPALCTHGRQVRDLLHVEDVAAAFVALLDSNVEGAVNVGSGEPVALAEVVRLVGEKAGRPELIRMGARPAPEGEPPLLAADVTRLRDEVGWRPRFNLEAGLERTVEWWRNNLRGAKVREQE